MKGICMKWIVLAMAMTVGQGEVLARPLRAAPETANVSARGRQLAAKKAAPARRAPGKKKARPVSVPAPQMDPAVEAPVIADEPPTDEAPPTPVVAAVPEPAPASAAPVPTVAAAVPVEATPEKPEGKLSLDALRARYDALRDAVFRQRARRETLEKALFSTKLAVSLTWEADRNFSLKRAELRLDGTRLWESGDRSVGEDPILLTARPVPPGPHVVALRLEVRSRDNPDLGYTSEQSFSISLPEGKQSKLEITVDEDGDLPSYNPDIEIELDVDD
jgi:hypothetical protein